MKWICHEREARMIYILTTDRHLVIYWARKSHVSKTLFRFKHTRNDEKTSVSFRGSQFIAITWKEIPPRTLNVMEAFILLRKLFMRENDVTLFYVMEMKN